MCRPTYSRAPGPPAPAPVSSSAAWQPEPVGGRKKTMADLFKQPAPAPLQPQPAPVPPPTQNGPDEMSHRDSGPAQELVCHGSLTFLFLLQSVNHYGTLIMPCACKVSCSRPVPLRAGGPLAWGPGRERAAQGPQQPGARPLPATRPHHQRRAGARALPFAHGLNRNRMHTGKPAPNVIPSTVRRCRARRHATRPAQPAWAA
jgi:hypothetical protein